MELEREQYEGYRAALNGVSIDDSPYVANCDENNDWLIGFRYGLEDI